MAKKKRMLVFNKATGKHERDKSIPSMGMSGVIKSMFDGSPSRQDMIDARIAEAVDGIKAAQDRIAGIKRRK